MLLSTRDIDSFYNIIVRSCIKRSEIYLNKKIGFCKIKNSKLPNFLLLIKIIFFIFSGSIFFKKKRLNFKYHNIEFGRFITASVYRDYRSYTSNFIFFRNYILNLFLALKIYKTSQNYLNMNFNILYVDHAGYLNGILYTAFSNANKIVFTNNYPKSIFGIDFKKKKNLIFKKYENSLKIYKKNKYKKSFVRAKNILKRLTGGDIKILPWMGNTKFYKLNNIEDLNKYDYIVYAHSFTDAQLWFGLDGFENSYDWLDYTLTNLKNKNKKVIIKTHPNYFNTSLAKNLTYWDKKIFDLLYLKFKDCSSFYFIRYPLKNSDLTKILNKKTICITHHGSVAIELAFLGFKTISSAANFYSDKFKISNFWKSKKEYLNCLNKDWNNLKKPILKDVFHLTDQLFLGDDSYNGKNSYSKVVARVLGKSLNNLTKKNSLFNHSNLKKNKFTNNVSQNQLDKIIDILGKKIKIR